MSNFLLRDKSQGNERAFESKAEAESAAEDLRSLGADVEIIAPTQNEGTLNEPGDTDVVDMTDGGTGVETPTETDSLPAEKPSVDEDPLDWVPAHFKDTIRGVAVLNRKAYAVLCERYDITVKAEPVTLPSETDFEFAEFKAIATTADGNCYTGFGSAHIERDDDKFILGELAETRAMKRAAAWGTGIGMTAMEELTGEL